MRPSRLPRHAAAADARRPRNTTLPAVLLSTLALAFGGLAALPSDGLSDVTIAAAGATAPAVTDISGPTEQQYDDLYGIPDNPVPVAAKAKPAAPARTQDRASRSRRANTAGDAVTGTEKLAPGTFVRPSTGRLTSTYKWRWGRMHTGIDIAGPYGSPVRAVTNGVVLEAGRESGYGNIVKLRHPDGSVTYYAHNSRLLVSEGERVDAGQIIAREGSTGHSTGPHVHFEVRIDGNPINPIPWLRKRGVYL